MTAVENEALPVEPEAMPEYRSATPERRRMLENLHRRGIPYRPQRYATFEELQADMSRKAQERGLTPEILAEILADDE